MKILLVGSGGREHALAWKLKQSPLVTHVYVAPGNGGTALEAENVNIKDNDIPGLVAFAKKKNIDLVVTGPELPLVLGLGDELKQAGIPCFGPGSYAAQLEGSKAFAKEIMDAAGVPTAACEIFTEYEPARAYLENCAIPVVVKADGLAAGKGVVVAQTRVEAQEALDQCMRDNAFGDAGAKVVIEEFLQGEEASFLAFCDGEHVLCMPSSQDHKAVGEGDTGPNTGGMGAYSPAPVLPESRYAEAAGKVIMPIVKEMAKRGHPFVGILYAGLMLKGGEMKVLEYNVRFGDPECQPLLMRLKSDLAEIMLACVEGRLHTLDVQYHRETSICVVMAAGGYPGSYPKGMLIERLSLADAIDGVKVFHAGTTFADGQVVTSGGRVLGVTALGLDLSDAKRKAYEAVEKIHFDTCYYRRDIGDKGLRKA